tara:strand:- start:18097 stop:18708 length:612 start_codon:yes stop_codon:yes gene_type:complete
MKVRLKESELIEMIEKTIKEGHSKSYMAKSQLYNIAKKAQSMFDKLGENEPLDDWMESKIAQMASMMDSVSNSFSYDDHKEKKCPDGMYWCGSDNICKPDSQKMGEINITTDLQLNEIGFTTSYSQESESNLDDFIDVVSGPVRSLRREKSFSNGNPIVQRIYQLVVEGGELHKPTQELLDLLEELDDKQSNRPIGFSVGGKQ